MKQPSLHILVSHPDILGAGFHLSPRRILDLLAPYGEPVETVAWMQPQHYKNAEIHRQWTDFTVIPAPREKNGPQIERKMRAWVYDIPRGDVVAILVKGREHHELTMLMREMRAKKVKTLLLALDRNCRLLAKEADEALLLQSNAPTLGPGVRHVKSSESVQAVAARRDTIDLLEQEEPTVFALIEAILEVSTSSYLDAADVQAIETLMPRFLALDPLPDVAFAILSILRHRSKAASCRHGPTELCTHTAVSWDRVRADLLAYQIPLSAIERASDILCTEGTLCFPEPLGRLYARPYDNMVFRLARDLWNVWSITRPKEIAARLISALEILATTGKLECETPEDMNMALELQILANIAKLDNPRAQVRLLAAWGMREREALRFLSQVERLVLDHLDPRNPPALAATSASYRPALPAAKTGLPGLLQAC